MEKSDKLPSGRKPGRVWAMAIFCLSLNLIVFASGCASESKRVSTTARAESLAADSSSQSQPVVVEKETRTTHVRHEPQGVLSTTVHVIGEILALPFRLIGGLLRLIF